MADETRYDRDRYRQDYDRDREDYRGRDYGREDWGREDRGRGWRGEGSYRGEVAYGRGGRDYYGREGGYGYGYGREGAGYGGYGYGEGGLGYGREGYGYGGYGREDFGRRSGEEYGRHFGRERDHGHGGYGRGGYYGRGGEERGFWDRASDEVRSWFGDRDAERRRETDDRRGYGYGGDGEHRGRGPRNYTRSDDRIREDVNDRLSDDPHIDASEVAVRVSDGEVTLDGTVRSRWDKRHAEDIVDDVSGVKHVQNNLRVQQQGALTGTAGQTAGTAHQGQTTPTAANEPTSGRGRSSAA
jgi:osmotically-inducible protein OsmY